MSFSPGQALLHASSASTMAFGFSRLHTLPVNEWMENQYGGHFQFLTIQGLVIAWFTMVVGLLANLFPTFQAFKHIKRALFIVALPLSVVISSVYWTLIIFFPSLIIQQMPGTSSPTSMDVEPFQIPLPVDLALHATPALTLLADFLLFEAKYSKRALNSVAPLSTLIFAVWYGTWAEYCAQRNDGIFPYPFLTDNAFEIRVAIYAGASIIAYGSFWILNCFHPRSK